jgi:hypothetical protein
MKTRSSSLSYLRETLAAVVAGTLMSWVPAPAAPSTEPPSEAKPPATAAPQSAEARLRSQWEKEIARIPVPKKGCFTATYPSKQWKEVPCVTPPKRPFLPAQGSRPYNVGGSNDVTANVGTAQISSAVGSFDTVSPATVTSNAFSLQLNTAPFNTTVCAGQGTCKGWEQFVYSQSGCTQNGNPVPCVLIQYWLLNAPNCPAGFTPSPPHCVQTPPPSGAPLVAAAQLLGTTLTGTVTATTDSIVLTSPGGPATANAADSLLNLSGAWGEVEFNVFGDGGGSTVNFNPAGTTTIVPRVTLTDGSNKKPACRFTGYTAEQNNLNLGPNAPLPSGTGPGLLFTESGPGGAAGCAAATSIGDTHLTTFAGTLYDFQASGDYVLVQTTNPDFAVHARQRSGAPNWPNASINKAVGVRMGKTRVAICLPPKGLVIDGKPTALEDGKRMALPDGADILKRDQTYLIRDAAGDSVQAAVIDPYINISVGLGRWPSDGRGVLANAREDVHLIAARDGAVLSAPFSFQPLYHHYAESWRVGAEESALAGCGEGKAEPGLPRVPFYANNLPPDTHKKARAVCAAAGVKVKPLLDACTLDVAVIGQDSAATVYVGMHAPALVGDARPGHPDHDHDHDRDHDKDDQGHRH